MGGLQCETRLPLVVEPRCGPERVQGMATLTQASVTPVLELVPVR